MADPLSVSAGIAGLISLADIVFRRTYKYVRAAAKAKDEISALSSELGSLHGVLCTLRPVVEQLEAEEPDLTARVVQITTCEKTLNKCRTILDKDQNNSQDRKWRDLRRDLCWPFKSEDVKTLIGEIQRHKTTLGLALQADSTRSLLQVLSGQQTLANGIQDIQIEMRQKREIDRRVVLEAKDEKMLDTFGQIDHHRSHVMNRRLRQAGTGTWLLEHDIFQKWWQSPNDTLWLYGIPGAGKTILSSLAIDTLIADCTPDHAVVYFCCDYKDAQTQEPHAILGNLIQQVAKQNEDSLMEIAKIL